MNRMFMRCWVAGLIGAALLGGCSPSKTVETTDPTLVGLLATVSIILGCVVVVPILLKVTQKFQAWLDDVWP